VMRVADADLLPYDFANLADTIGGYSTELKALVKQLQHETSTRQRNIDMGVYKLAADPEHPVALPGSLSGPPEIDFAQLDNAIAQLKAAAEKFNKARAAGVAASPEKLNAVNAELAMAERKFLSADGLPRRPWTKNILYAPGFYTGYGVKTLPGIREALEARNYPEAEAQMKIAAQAIANEAAYVDKIAAEIAAH
jgi:N-acetylated-alpha-linked acidic dipeptidase